MMSDFQDHLVGERNVTFARFSRIWKPPAKGVIIEPISGIPWTAAVIFMVKQPLASPTTTPVPASSARPCKVKNSLSGE